MPGDGEMWQDAGVDREHVIATLREHEAELKSAGIVRLSVFGSVARGDQTAQSDVDLIAEFDKDKHYTLLTMEGSEPPCRFIGDKG